MKIMNPLQRETFWFPFFSEGRGRSTLSRISQNHEFSVISHKLVCNILLIDWYSDCDCKFFPLRFCRPKGRRRWKKVQASLHIWRCFATFLFISLIRERLLSCLLDGTFFVGPFCDSGASPYFAFCPLLPPNNFLCAHTFVSNVHACLD